MGYQVKWVEEHLGITRKALRGYEKMGLMPENQGRKYRDYDEDDINRIWAIKLLQGMGYTLKEIVEMEQDLEFDFYNSIGEKISSLEEKQKDIERHIGYAKAIKSSGRFPLRPKEMGSMKFDEFQEKALEEWNIQADPLMEKCQEFIEKQLTYDEDDWTEKDLGGILDVLCSFDLSDDGMESLFANHVLLKMLTKKKSLGAEHQQIQTIVQLIYEHQCENAPADISNITPESFARIFGSQFIAGDIAKVNEKQYGKDGCDFIADAIAFFGGCGDQHNLT